MKPGINFTKEWSDGDLLELRVEVCDGSSLFVNHIYVARQQLEDAVEGLGVFKDQIHGGLFDLRFGEFGPEYSNGALDARLQFRANGKIFVQVAAQAGFERFGEKEFASEAKLYLLTEPALLDDFIRALKALSDAHTSNAELDAIYWN